MHLLKGTSGTNTVSLEPLNPLIWVLFSGHSHVTKCKVLEDKDMFYFCCCVLFSRDAPAGAHYLANDFNSALELVETKLAEKADQIWILGGSSVYKVRNTEHLGLFHC